MRFFPAVSEKSAWVCRGAAVLALAAFVSWPALSQEQQGQGQQGQQGQQQQQGQGQQAQAQEQGQQPSQASATPNANRPPVTSQDRVPDYPPDAPYGQTPYPGPYSRGYGQRYGSQNAQQSFPPAPAELTIPSGTVVIVRTNDFLSSDKNQAGDQFTGTLQQPIVVNGYVVARRGETVIGKVKSAQKAGRVKGTSQLGVELTDLTLVDGQQAPILTELWKASGGTSHGADAATIVGGSALGAAIGAAADWGKGAAIGGGAGALAGIGAVLLTRGRPTIVPPEAELSFKLVDPVRIDTSTSQSAFVPPTQEDFGYGRPTLRGYGPGPYGPYEGQGYPYAYAPAPCGYSYPCYGYYGPYVGVYPGFWWGGWYGRGFYGPRFRRF